MPKRTIALIILLTLIVASLITIAVPKKTPPISTVVPSQTLPPSPTVTPSGHTSLSFSTNPLIISPSTTASNSAIDILIDTTTDEFRGAQIELKFDPSVIQITDITPGTFLAKPNILLKSINNTSGKLFYAFVIPQTVAPIQGSGILAHIMFTHNLIPSQQTAITFLPKTMISAAGSYTSALSTAKGTVILKTTIGTPPASLK